MTMNHLPTLELATPWGPAQDTARIAEGVYDVSTAVHGGIMVETRVARTLLSARALACGTAWHGYYAFEEDEAVAAFLYEQPALFAAYCRRGGSQITAANVRHSAEQTLRRWFPLYFAA